MRYEDLLSGANRNVDKAENAYHGAEMVLERVADIAHTEYEARNVESAGVNTASETTSSSPACPPSCTRDTPIAKPSSFVPHERRATAHLTRSPRHTAQGGSPAAPMARTLSTKPSPAVAVVEPNPVDPRAMAMSTSAASVSQPAGSGWLITG